MNDLQNHTEPSNTGSFLSVRDVAERLNMSRDFVYRQIGSGSLHHYVIGGSASHKGRIRISEEQFQSYLDARESRVKTYNFSMPAISQAQAGCVIPQNTIANKLNQLLGTSKKGKRKVN